MQSDVASAITYFHDHLHLNEIDTVILQDDKLTE